MNLMPRHVFATVLFCAAACPVALALDLTDEDRDRIEGELAETRAEIQRLSERLADLSIELVDEEIDMAMNSVQHMSHGDRAILGVVLTDMDDPKFEGPSISAVTPEGPADQAGLRTGDRIVALDGARISDDGKGARDIIRFMDRVEPGDTVAVTVERDGRERDFNVVTSQEEMTFAFSFNDEEFVFDGEALGETIGSVVSGAMHGLEMAFFGGVWPDVEVVELSPSLGDYFGVSEGLLVVRAPSDDSLDIRDGDVLIEVDGQSLTEQSDLFRVLGKVKSDDTVALKLVRQRQTLTIDAQIPDVSGRHGPGAQIFIRRSGDDD